MLFPAVILAILCVVWGFVEPWLGNFMQVEAELSLIGAFFNLETPIFLALLVPTGLIIYLTYYKNSEIMSKFRSSSNPLMKILNRGYFFDDLYERTIAKAIVSFSKGVRFVEVVLFNKIPLIVAWSVIILANAVHNHLDTLADDLLVVLARSTMRSASQAKKLPSTSLQHYVAAAMIGFILIVILIILTIGV
jgi:NADH:ubiquinone oxidoreductase subunit 5 (subunit L)/multisubunit Na+/H+ antiporter MnhA subunit